jgi:hypothetical protein
LQGELNRFHIPSKIQRGLLVNIWKPDMQIPEPFEFQTNRCPVIKCLKTRWLTAIWNLDQISKHINKSIGVFLNPNRIVQISDHHLKSGPFDSWKTLSNPKSRLVQFSDVFCSLMFKWFNTARTRHLKTKPFKTGLGFFNKEMI